MNNLLKGLIPQGRKGLAIWLLLMILMYWFYYFGWPFHSSPYASFEEWAYQQKVPDRQYFDAETFPGINVALVEAPLYVADFLENEIVMTVENTSGRPQTISATAMYEPNQEDDHARIQVYGIGSEARQNTVILKDIPPFTQAKAVFGVRVANAESGDNYHIKFLVNQQEFTTASDLRMTFSRGKRLRLWAVSMFLFPPGADIVLPIFTMLCTSWLQSFCSFLMEQAKAKSSCWKFLPDWIFLPAGSFQYWAFLFIIVLSICMFLPPTPYVVAGIGGLIAGTALCHIRVVHRYIGLQSNGKP